MLDDKELIRQLSKLLAPSAFHNKAAKERMDKIHRKAVRIYWPFVTLVETKLLRSMLEWAEKVTFPQLTYAIIDFARQRGIVLEEKKWELKTPGMALPARETQHSS